VLAELQSRKIETDSRETSVFSQSISHFPSLGNDEVEFVDTIFVYM